MRKYRILAYWIATLTILYLTIFAVYVKGFYDAKLYAVSHLKTIWLDVFPSNETYVEVDFSDFIKDVYVDGSVVLVAGSVGYKPSPTVVYPSALIAAYDVDGKLLWRHVVINPNVSSEFNGLEVYNDKVYAVGTIGGKAVIYVYNRRGDFIYTISLPRADEFIERGLEVYAWNNSLYVLTSRRILRMSFSGDILWSINLTGSAYFHSGVVYLVHKVADRLILEAVDHRGKVNLVANISLSEWMLSIGHGKARVDVYDLCIYRGRAYILMRINIVSEYHILLAIYDLRSGDYNLMEYSFSGRDHGGSVATANDAVYIAGFSYVKGWRKPLLIKTDLNGNLIWIWIPNLTVPSFSLVEDVDVVGDRIYIAGCTLNSQGMNSAFAMCLEEFKGTFIIENFVEYVLKPFVAKLTLLVPFSITLLPLIALLHIAYRDYREKRWRELVVSALILLTVIVIMVYFSRPAISNLTLLTYE